MSQVYIGVNKGSPCIVELTYLTAYSWVREGEARETDFSNGASVDGELKSKVMVVLSGFFDASSGTPYCSQ